MAYSAIKYTVDQDGIATMTLNRPNKLNCFSQEMFREWREVVEKIAYDRGVKILVITGEGRAFSSGVDLEVLGSEKSSAEFRFYYRQNHRRLRRSGSAGEAGHRRSQWPLLRWRHRACAVL